MDIFLEPKAETEVKDTNKAQSARPKFEPKAKLKGKAKASAAAPSKPQQKQEPKQQKPEEEQNSKTQVKDEFQNTKDASPETISLYVDLPMAKMEVDTVQSDEKHSKVVVKPEPDIEASVKLEPQPDIEVSVKPEQEIEVLIKPEEDVVMKDATPKKEEGDSPPGSPSSVQDEDTVVREIDVYLSPNINTDTKLYLLQYPLRPHWRPYGLEERCDSVRVKPKLTKLEMDLVVDTTGENYDQDADEHLQIKKQTLSSSKISLTTNYAVGLLRGNKLHLAPVDAVLQMRPSMKYLDEADTKRKSAKKLIEDEDMVDAEADEEEEEKEDVPQLVALKVEVKKQETERQEQMRLQSHAYLKELDAAEPWISLETHGTDSPVTDGIRHAMTSKATDQLPFNMPMSQYMKHLVPGRASSSSHETAAHDANADEGLSRSFLDTLPLEERFEKLLSKGRVHVLQFERLMKLAPPDCKEEEVLDVLEDTAFLVQGCWVAPSPLRYTGQICIVRDYILSLFAKSRVIRHDQLEELQVPKEMIREVLVPLAVQRPMEGGWEFQESTDRSFLKRHQVLAKRMMQRWSENEEHIKKAALSLSIGTSSTKSSSLNKNIPGPASAVGSGLNRLKTSAGTTFSGQWTMSEETRAALPGALSEIFSKHNVCSLPLIQQCLRDMTITKAMAANANPRMIAAAKAAADGAKAPLPELTAAISQVASNIDGVYFLTKLGNPSLDPFRDVVIALLRAKGPQTGLKRQDIIEASKIALKSEVPANVYQKVLKELCYTKGGAWVLKPGDGRPG